MRDIEKMRKTSNERKKKQRYKKTQDEGREKCSDRD